MPAKTLTIGNTWTVPSSVTYEFPKDNQLPHFSNVTISPSSNTVSSLEEAFNILFPDEESKRMYQEEKARMDQELLLRIRQGKVNPIRGWRILKGIDQKTLVERTGIGQSNLSRMEKLGVQPSRENLKIIAEALNVDIKELL